MSGIVDINIPIEDLAMRLCIEEQKVATLRTALAEAVEALEGCWARLKTDRELVQKHAGLGKVYDGLVEDAESALAAARAVSGDKA